MLNRTQQIIQILTIIQADRIIRPIHKLICLAAVLGISACATTNAPAPSDVPDVVPPEIKTAPPAEPDPDMPPPTTPVQDPAPHPHPSPSIPEPPAPVRPIPEPASPAFVALSHWQAANPTPALKALQKTFAVWKYRPDEKYIDDAHPKYGRYKDWRVPCRAALSLSTISMEASRDTAARFFQTHFEPVNTGADTGLLTAYYAPELANGFNRRGNSDEAYFKSYLEAWMAAQPLPINGRRKMPQFNVTEAQVNDLANFLIWT
ncbi:MAG: MltA domain-containing protein, partial [Robiginitomaculum sp.]|nr:MltA domain-containing protein [Robiginitomaculum sp.]